MLKHLNKVLLILPILLGSPTTQALSVTKTNISNCNINLTPEQKSVLRLAYLVGEPYDLGNTLQGIIMQESFVGNRIDRDREVSPTDTSYGVTHVRPSTLKWLTDKFDMYNIKVSSIKPFLTSPKGDVLALNVALHYLLLKQSQGKGYTQMLGEYNAGIYWQGESGKKYIDKVKRNVQYTTKCIEY